MNKVSQKKNNSSMQVIKTLQVLLQGNYSMQELIKMLNKDEMNSVFNNSVISKYINTCRYIGIDIPKINNKYFIASMPFGIDLSTSDLDIIEELTSVINQDKSFKNKTTFFEFLSKLNRYSNKNIAKVENEINNTLVELFERAIARKRKVNILFKNQVKIEATPLNILKIDEKIYFSVFNKKVKMIDSARVSGIELTEKKFIDSLDGDKVTIFVLKDNLAKRYEARDNESIEQNSDGTITVTNRNENKELLFSRLLRYQNSCEILKPKAYRDDFRQLIIDTLNNYGA